MKFFVRPAFLAAQALFEGGTLPVKDLFVALSITPFVATGDDLNAHHVADITSFVDYDGGAPYARQKVLAPVVSEDVLLHRWKLKGQNVAFGKLPAASSQVRYALIYQGTASSTDDNTNIPCAVIDNVDVDAFPFNGDGIKPINIRWNTAGIVIGPNC